MKKISGMLAVSLLLICLKHVGSISEKNKSLALVEKDCSSFKQLNIQQAISWVLVI